MVQSGTPTRARRRRRGRTAALPRCAAILAALAVGWTLGRWSGAAEAPQREEQTPAVAAQEGSVSFETPGLPCPSLQEGGAPSETPDLPSPSLDPEDWRLVLVNRWNPLPEGYRPPLVQLSNGLGVDERCLPDLQAMMDACRAEGLKPVICSAYRTWETQERLFQDQIQAQLALGLGQEDAKREAGKLVAVPGTSEHQLGLAVDIVDLDNQRLDKSQEDTAVQKWLLEHCVEFGFVLRYPGGKSEITGISYEPWHYRYVGREAAEVMRDEAACLEEYLGAGA